MDNILQLKKIRVVESSINDPVYNLSYEAYLTESVDKETLILFLWQNEHTIVIGTNQNPWKECQCKKFSEDKGKIIRRLSGGGAVYHDLGNLNFSIIAHKDHYDVDYNIEKLKKAINLLELKPEFSGKNDLTIQGRKFSGHAYFEIEENRCHHGSILVNSNLSTLSRYLTPSKLKISSKSIDSVRSRVANLTDFDPSINVRKVSESIIRCFEENLITIHETANKFSIEDMASNWLDLFSRWSWTFGESPNFDVSLEDRYNWGTVELNLKITNNKISDIKIYTDSNETKYFQNLMHSLTGLNFDEEIILSSIESVFSDNLNIMIDMKSLINKLI